MFSRTNWLSGEPRLFETEAILTVPPVRQAVYIPATRGASGIWGAKIGYPAMTAMTTARRPVIMAISWSRVSLFR